MNMPMEAVLIWKNRCACSGSAGAKITADKVTTARLASCKTVHSLLKNVNLLRLTLSGELNA